MPIQTNYNSAFFVTTTAAIATYYANYGRDRLGASVNSVLIAIMAYRVGGSKAALVTFNSAMLDEILISNNITSKHYITCGLVSQALLRDLKLPLVHEKLGEVVKLSSALIFSRYIADDIFNCVNEPIKLAVKAAKIILPLFADTQNSTSVLASTYAKYALEQFGISMVKTGVTFTIIKFISNYDTLINKQLMTEPLPDNFDYYTKHALLFAGYLAAYGAVPIGCDYASEWLRSYMMSDVRNRARDLLSDNENVLKLSNNNNAFTSNFVDDFERSCVSTTAAADLLSKAIVGTYNIGDVYNKYPLAMAAQMVFAEIYSIFRSHINDVTSRNSERLYRSKDERDVVQSYYRDNIKELSISRGLKQIDAKLNQLDQAINDIEYHNNIVKIFHSMDFPINYYIPHIIYGLAMYPSLKSGTLTLAEFFNAAKIDSVMELYNFGKTFISTNIYSIVSTDRLKSALLEISKGLDGYLVVSKEYNHDAMLILRNVTLYNNGEVVLRIGDREDMAFHLGRFYVLTGATGSGKTSLLKKIMGIKYDGIQASGTIIYPEQDGQEAKIVTITQNELILPYGTLADILYFPQQLPQDSAEKNAVLVKMKDLLKEVGMQNFASDIQSSMASSDQPWSQTLSGGQKKAVALISAILQKPDILLLDEVFAGMDSILISKAQKLLKNNLPLSMIMVIDHEATSHNMDEFYDAKCHLEDKTMNCSPFTMSEMCDYIEHLHYEKCG